MLYQGTCNLLETISGKVCKMIIPLAILLTSLPSGSRDLVEFGFFMAVGITAGSLGII